MAKKGEGRTWARKKECPWQSTRHLTLCFVVVKFGKGNKTTMSLRSCGGGWFRYYSHCHNVFPVSAFVSSPLTPIGCCLCRLTGSFGCCSSLHDTGWPWFGRRHACIEVRTAQPFLATENRTTKTMKNYSKDIPSFF